MMLCNVPMSDVPARNCNLKLMKWHVLTCHDFQVCHWITRQPNIINEQ